MIQGCRASSVTVHTLCVIDLMLKSGSGMIYDFGDSVHVTDDVAKFKSALHSGYK